MPLVRRALASPFGTTVMIVLMIATSGCSDDAGNSGPPGRGSPKCHDWQAAYCGLMARCLGPVDQGPVDLCGQAKSVYCKDDELAARCASALSSSACVAAPSGCDLEDLADPAPAKKACDDWETALCEHDDRCGVDTFDKCLGSFQLAVNCTRAIGVMQNYEQCMADIPNAPCTTASLPATCKNVLLF